MVYIIYIITFFYYYYRLFRTYDFDNDGKISLYDLKMTLEIQNGRDYNVSNQDGEDYALLCTWISQRDTTGTGYVNYEDFVNYYNKEEQHGED